jgi:hypothetical protein
MAKPTAYKGKRLRPLLASAAENAASAERTAADALTPDWNDIQNKPTTFPSDSSSGSTVMIDLGGGDHDELWPIPVITQQSGVGSPGPTGSHGTDRLSRTDRFVWSGR